MIVTILLAAIAIVESNNNDMVNGKAGEVSRYQILPSTWKQYAVFHKDYYTDPVASLDVAKMHLRTITRALPKSKRDSIYWHAAAWNAGSAGVKRTKYIQKNLPKSTQEYCKKVLIEYEKLEKKKRITAAEFYSTHWNGEVRPINKTTT